MPVATARHVCAALHPKEAAAASATGRPRVRSTLPRVNWLRKLLGRKSEKPEPAPYRDSAGRLTPKDVNEQDAAEVRSDQIDEEGFRKRGEE
jgi:hypothetical protein